MPREYSPERTQLLEYIADYAREFRDKAPLSSSVTRTENLFKRSGLPLQVFIEKMVIARAITKEHTASIKKGNPGQREAMAYFFAVLQDQLKM